MEMDLHRTELWIYYYDIVARVNEEVSLMFERICVVGLGYIGLPTAALFAARGVKVLGVDINPHVIDAVNKGEVHIVEPGLDILVKEGVSSQNLKAFLAPQEAEAYIIAVPTPFEEGYIPDLVHVFEATRSLAPLLKKGDLVVLESTSPVGTTEKISKLLRELRPDLTFPHQEQDNPDIHIAYCPERILPGQALRELVDNDRIVGGLSVSCTHKAIDLYRLFVKGACIPTQARTAEMSKLTENAFRDVNIAFANELSLLCDRLEINVWELINLANHHPRVHILRPGPGVGGHCIAVDPWFLVWSCPEESKLIRLAREINDGKPHHVVRKVEQISLELNHPPVACFGLAFKPDIDDLRESPSLEIVRHLATQNHKQTFYVIEPNIVDLPRNLKDLPNIQLVSSTDALQHSKIAVMLVNHKEFYNIPASHLKNKHIIDTQGVWVG
jgi:UDP-N-acetyl-D-mannosaminuronic acid dehydrogenase